MTAEEYKNIHDDLRKMVHDTTRLAIKEELGHFVGMTKDLGAGSFDKGIEIQRDNHKWMSLQRKQSERISLAIKIFIITTLLSGMIYAIVEGAKKVLGK